MRPSASATAGLVTAPPAVFTPLASSGSCVVASTTPWVAERDRVRQRGVGERVRRRVRHRGGDVADRVVQHAVHLVHRVRVRRLADALDAPALVDRAVDDHRAGAHRRDHRVGHHHRRAAAGHEHRADHEIGVGDRAFDREAVAGERHDPSSMDLVDPAQAVEVLVEQEHLGLHALRDPRRVPPDVAGAEHHDPRRTHPRRTAEQHPAAAVLTLEEVRADLRRHAPGDLAHRREQRQRARCRPAPSRRRRR